MWLARHSNGMKCTVTLRDVLQRLSQAGADDVIRVDAATVVIGSWSFTRKAVV